MRILELLVYQQLCLTIGMLEQLWELLSKVDFFISIKVTGQFHLNSYFVELPRRKGLEKWWWSMKFFMKKLFREYPIIRWSFLCIPEETQLELPIILGKQLMQKMNPTKS